METIKDTTPHGVGREPWDHSEVPDSERERGRGQGSSFFLEGWKHGEPLALACEGRVAQTLWPPYLEKTGRELAPEEESGADRTWF